LKTKALRLAACSSFDPEGIRRYKVIHDLNIVALVEETLRVIQALQTGGLCQAEWKPVRRL